MGCGLCRSVDIDIIVTHVSRCAAHYAPLTRDTIRSPITLLFRRDKLLPTIKLASVSQEDVKRVVQWLEDSEVNAAWYGTDEHGEPLHIGYSPKGLSPEGLPPEGLTEAREVGWERIFDNDLRKIYSVLSEDGEHIGEAQMVIEAPLREAQLFILIGRKDLWYRGYGTAALVHLLDLAFYTHGLHRAWVDVPEYNAPALHMCERLGFVLEGHLRGTRPKDGKWYDSLAMGLLSNEYARRRSRVLEGAGDQAV